MRPRKTGQPAATEYRRLRVFQRGTGTEGEQRDGQEPEAYSLVEVSPISGRLRRGYSVILPNNFRLYGESLLKPKNYSDQ